MNKKLSKPTPQEYASWILAVLGLLFVLQFRLLPALIAGLAPHWLTI